MLLPNLNVTLFELLNNLVIDLGQTNWFNIFIVQFVVLLVKLLIDKISTQKADQDTAMISNIGRQRRLTGQYFYQSDNDKYLYLSFCVNLSLNLDFFRGELLLKNASLNRLDVSSPRLSWALASMTGFLRA